MLQALDAAAARQWAGLAVVALASDRDAIDRINVYPVADGDTGTNLLQTMRSAVAAVESANPDTVGGVLSALARGALLGARGNSGMLLSQVMRGLAEELRDAAGMDGRSLCQALARADKLARKAVSKPATGTILSVLSASAQTAAGCESQRLGVVVREVTTSAIRALSRTTAQLPVLAHAGVVDAGGRGLVILLDTLHAVVNDGKRLAPEPPRGGHPVRTESNHHASSYAYEVMYLIAGADVPGTVRLQESLCGVGDCVSVISDGGNSEDARSWAVHVHCDDIGAAIEAGIETGRVHGIQVTRFADQVAEEKQPYTSDHAVLACVRGHELAELFRAEGASVLLLDDDRPLATEDLLTEIGMTSAQRVVVLPNDEIVTALAEEAAGRAVQDGQDVVVIPTVSPVQGLAALAVHDPSRRGADDSVAMAEAAAATRRGELIIAAREALTWAGRCQAGDVLGLADGEVVLIGTDLVSIACELADRMLAAGGELVTALVSTAAPDELVDKIADHLRRNRPEVEFACYPAGQLAAPLLLGVE